MLRKPVFLAILLGFAPIGTLPTEASGFGRHRDGDERPIVAVFDIETKLIHIGRSMLLALSDYLANCLSRYYQIVPRSRLKKRLMAEKTKAYKHCYDQSCQIEIGRELAANKSLATQIMRIGKKCVVTANLYDLKRATTEKGAAAKGKCSRDAITSLIEKVVWRLEHYWEPNQKSLKSTSLRRSGTLVVTSLRYGTIFIDGKKVGHTPRMVIDLPSGEHSVEVRFTPSAKKKKRIIIRDGETIQAHFRMDIRPDDQVDPFGS